VRKLGNFLTSKKDLVGVTSRKGVVYSINAVVPNLFDAFLPLLILELFIPPLFGFDGLY